MTYTSSSSQLCSLTEWSITHIRSIFEADTDDDALDAISGTFSPTLSATLNGVPLPREGLEKLVLSMRHGSFGGNGLRVQWKYTMEVPKDSTNREGAFGGVYTISGLRKTLPGSGMAAYFTRHKTVTVNIESQGSEEPNVDSRRIVSLVFVASDMQEDI
ncbi:hypothetical protein E1B28_011047 [Marasmius oreades]|uniref:Uncharacterized protein n=1 Tax=Marasmius oreades TaxID=181124 RepID=A0A9P7UP47_9AGAR|nr:uncharacterized protein E1B28_011047 [Marasmius oreades]KAG7089357.1 hypothetical protein E1B28_011047 [Marasmius oreades]